MSEDGPRGSCLCGRVRYRVRTVERRISHCHCSMCRKQHGAVAGTYAGAAWDDFEWTAGEEQVARYESSPGIERTFCRHCGSSLQFVDRSDARRFALAIGTLDDDPGPLEAVHIYVASRAPWHEIRDDLPQHDD